MSYTPRFGEITADTPFNNAIRKLDYERAQMFHCLVIPKIENSDTRWIIAMYSPYKVRLVDNYGNIIHHDFASKQPMSAPQNNTIPLSDDIITLIKAESLYTDNDEWFERYIQLMTTLARSHYNQHQENVALKKRLETLEAILTQSHPNTTPESHSNDLLDLTPTNPFDEFESPVNEIQTFDAKQQDLKQDPRQQGFELETHIHASIQALHPSLMVRREQDIRNEFNDQSLNGVDHWITNQNVHIMIQTKWRETTTQPEVTQFLTCVDRIQARLPSDAKVHLIWACKHSPTKHALATLNERKVQILPSNISIYDLTRRVAMYVADMFEFDISPALNVIPMQKMQIEQTQSPTYRVQDAGISPKSVKTEFDDTEEGKALREDMEQCIESEIVRNICSLMNKTQYSTHESNRVVVDTAFPKTLHEWTNGQRRKVDFNKMLRTLKSANYPTPKEPKPVTLFPMYCKMRYISTILANIALVYNAKYNTMLAKKSTWVKLLPILKCDAEPMMDAEWRSALKHTKESREGGMQYYRIKDRYDDQFSKHYFVN